MEPLIIFALAWVFMRAWETVKTEFSHNTGRHATSLTKDHPDWSPRRVQRHARARSLSHWGGEARHGFPTFRNAWLAHYLDARAGLEEARANGEATIRELRERLEAARQKRLAAREKPDGEPAPAEPEPAPVAGGEPPEEAKPEPPPAAPELCEVCAAPGTERWPLVTHDGQRMHETHLKVPVTLPAGPEPVLSDWVRPGEPLCETCGGRGRPAGMQPPDVCPDCGGFGSQFPDEPPGDVPGSPSTSTGGTMTTGMPGPLESLSGAYIPPGTRDGRSAGGSGPGVEDGGDTPYEAMRAFAASLTQSAWDAAHKVGDDLRAVATVNGFGRDNATMAEIAAIEDAYSTAAEQARALCDGLRARHSEGAEYHGTGQDAHAEAFRPA